MGNKVDNFTTHPEGVFYSPDITKILWGLYIEISFQFKMVAKHLF